MLCQNCKLRQANVFIKRSINGKSKELHLCSDCAEKLGYSDMFNKPVFSGFGSLFENFFNAPSILSGESFFSLPSLFGEDFSGNYNKQTHPQIAYTVVDNNNSNEGKSDLQKELEMAIDEENFEEAARLRDLIRENKEKEDKDEKGE